MAITILSQPNRLEPAYQDYISWVVSSTLVNNLNFKYNFDVYTGRTPTLATNFKTRVRTFPRTSGACVYSPTYVLQSDLTYNLQPGAGIFGATNPLEARESEIFYKIQFLEQWNPSASFIGLQNNGGNVQYNFGFSHGFLPGDTITIQMNNQLLNPSYNGTQSVLSVGGFGNSNLTTDKPFGTPYTIAEPGLVYDVVRPGLTSSTFRALNGARQYVDKSIDWATEYEMNNTKTDSEFLSVWPVQYQKPVYFLDNNYYFSEVLGYVFSPTANIGNAYWVINWFDDTGTLQASDSGTSLVVSPNAFRYDLNVGSNFGVQISTLPNTNITNYEVSIIDIVSGLTMSETRKYKLVQQCKDYDLIQIAFKNKLGGFDFWVFNRVSKYTSNINRKEIRKPFRYNWQIGDRGRTIVHQDIVETWKVNTDWLEDHEALFIRELIESPEVYVLDYSNQTNPFPNPQPPNKLPIIITSNKYDYKSKKNDMIFQYEIEYQYAYNVESNV